jgi:hypothetical protein
MHMIRKGQLRTKGNLRPAQAWHKAIPVHDPTSATWEICDKTPSAAPRCCGLLIQSRRRGYVRPEFKPSARPQSVVRVGVDRYQLRVCDTPPAAVSPAGITILQTGASGRRVRLSLRPRGVGLHIGNREGCLHIGNREGYCQARHHGETADGPRVIQFNNAALKLTEINLVGFDTSPAAVSPAGTP